MNFALLNIQCLISKRTNKLKLKELSHIFENNDLILLTETWTNESSEICRTDRKQKSNGYIQKQNTLTRVSIPQVWLEWD